MSEQIDNILAGLSAAFAFQLWILAALCWARVWQCRKEYLHWSSTDVERKPVLVLMVSLSGLSVIFLWRMIRATFAWWHELWRITGLELQDMIALPLGICFTAGALWWAYTRVFGYHRGIACWKLMLLCTFIVGFISAL